MGKDLRGSSLKSGSKSSRFQFSRGDMELSLQQKQIRDKKRDINVKDIRDLQLTRKQLTRAIDEPYFKDFIKNKYVRLSIGSRVSKSTGDKKRVYRLGEIIGVQTLAKTYKLLENDKKKSNSGIIIRIGKQERAWEINFVSNDGFKDYEFEEWKERMRAHSMALPTPGQLQDRLLQAKKDLQTFRYDQQALDSLRKRKKQTRDIQSIPNLHKEKLKLESEHGACEDEHEKERLQSQINSIKHELERRSLNKKDQLSYEEIMRRNREKTMENMRRARALRGKEGQHQGSYLFDAFSRTLTAPTNEAFASSINDNDNNNGNNGNSNNNNKNNKNDKSKNKNDQKKGDKSKKSTFSPSPVKHEIFTKDISLNLKESFAKRRRLLLQQSKNKKIDKNKENDEKVKGLDDDEDIVNNNNNNNRNGNRNDNKDDDANSQDTNKLIQKEDSLWGIIDNISKNFIDKIETAPLRLPRHKSPQPQFGRVSQQSNYANEFVKPPENGQILTFEQYANEQHSGWR